MIATKVKVLVDNKASIHSPTIFNNNNIKYMGYSSRTLIAEHGFSLLVKDGNEQFLFDVGSDVDVNGASVLQHNLHALNIPISTISRIILSHRHTDHAGGLSYLLKEKSAPKDIILHKNSLRPYFVKLNKNFNFDSNRMDSLDLSLLSKKGDISKVKRLSDYLSVNINIQTEFINKKISKNITFLSNIDRKEVSERTENKFYSIIGDETIVVDDNSDDSALIFEVDGGYHLLLGCCHSGLVNTLNAVEDLCGTDLIGIIGGMHMVPSDSNMFHDRMKKSIDKLRLLKPKFIVAGHCSGEEFFCKIKKENLPVFPSYVGMEID